ncbi:hypothetical protein GUITHDRAFT_149807, partial [Guillardia theta CCMP2712]
MQNGTIDPSFSNSISNMSMNLPPMSSQGMPTNQAAHQNINNRDMQGISPVQVSRNVQRQGDAANAPPHGSFGFGAEGIPTISHAGHGMSFALPSVTS